MPVSEPENPRFSAFEKEFPTLSVSSKKSLRYSVLKLSTEERDENPPVILLRNIMLTIRIYSSVTVFYSFIENIPPGKAGCPLMKNNPGLSLVKIPINFLRCLYKLINR